MPLSVKPTFSPFLGPPLPGVAPGVAVRLGLYDEARDALRQEISPALRYSRADHVSRVVPGRPAASHVPQTGGLGVAGSNPVAPTIIPNTWQTARPTWVIACGVASTGTRGDSPVARAR